jgi:hypothetical protein
MGMVEAFHTNLLRFLAALHDSRVAAGIEAQQRQLPDATDTRTIYRWQHELGDDLVYYPTITFSRLGLEYLHLFIWDASDRWLHFPYAVRAEWVIGRPSEPVLYLQCLVPCIHRDDLALVLDDLRGTDACRDITMITSSDGWQVAQFTSAPARAPPPLRGEPVWDVVERLPLLIPVIFEMVEQRRSLPATWEAIYERLGNDVWAYLPRFARRLPTNGKSYVKDALALVNNADLFRQNVIRYAPIERISTPMFLRVEGPLDAIIHGLAEHAATLDLYPLSQDTALVRVSVSHAQLQHVLTTMRDVPRITEWYFVDRVRNEQMARPRFAYEILFNPATTEWRFPREEIIRRISR